MAIIHVAGEHVTTVDAVRQQERLQPGGRKLNGFAGMSPDHELFHAASIVIEVLVQRQVQLKFVSIQVRSFFATSATRLPSTRAIARSPSAGCSSP